MSDNKICIGGVYRHFKGNNYQVIAIASHSETLEKMVVYQALYGDYGFYVRPLDMFTEEVDKTKYPNAMQRYRFELINLPNNNLSIRNSIETEKSTDINKTLPNYKDNIIIEQNNDTLKDVNPFLMSFLDADTCNEKIEVLKYARENNAITFELLRDMSASLDCVIDEKGLDEQYDSIYRYLRMKSKYECSRLR